MLRAGVALVNQKLTPSLVISALLALFFVCHRVAAATITYSTTTEDGQGYPELNTDWTNSLAFPQFDPSFGALQSVELDLKGTTTTKITLTNNSEFGSTGTAFTTVAYVVQDDDNMLQPLNAPDVPPKYLPQLSVDSGHFDFQLDAGGQQTSDPLFGNGTSSNTYNAAPILAEFSGNGSIALTASTFTKVTVSINTGGGTDGSQSTSASLTGSVTYTYTAAPEPSTLTLLALGAIGLVVVRRRPSISFLR
jgi:PEP-CTERM motif